MTREGFIAALRACVIRTHPWARTDATPERLDAFMELTRATMIGGPHLVCITGECFTNAWREIGCKGRPSYIGLRALPHEEVCPPLSEILA